MSVILVMFSEFFIEGEEYKDTIVEWPSSSSDPLLTVCSRNSSWGEDGKDAKLIASTPPSEGTWRSGDGVLLLCGVENYINKL